MSSKSSSSRSSIKSWYAVDINTEQIYKRTHMPSSESEGSGGRHSGRGGISNQTYSGINLCEIDSLEDVLRLSAEYEAARGKYTGIATACGSRQSQKIQNKSFTAEYNGNHGIDVYQEPEFDDYDPFADEAVISPQNLKTSGNNHGEALEQAYLRRLETEELSFRDDLLECESDYESQKFGRTSKNSHDESTSTAVLRKQSASGKGTTEEISKASEISRRIQNFDRDLRRDSDQFKVFDAITPEAITDDECYIGNDFPEEKIHRPTVAEEVLRNSTMDEALRPGDVPGYSFLLDSSGTVSPIIDTESQAAIFENLSFDENFKVEENEDELIKVENPEKGFISPPISTGSASLLAKIASKSHFGAGSSEPEDIHVVTRTLSPTKCSSDDIYVDAAEDLIPEENSLKASESERPNPFRNLLQASSTQLSKKASKKLIGSSITAENASSAAGSAIYEDSASVQNSVTESCTPPENASKEKESGYFNSCTKVFHKLFQVYINEVEESAPEEETPFVIPTQRKSTINQTQPKKILSVQNIQVQEPSPPQPEDFHTLVDDELLEYINQEKNLPPETDTGDKVCVEILLNPTKAGTSRSGSVQKRTVALEFPVHREDLESAMIVVNNPHLQSSKVQYVNTPSEIVYNLPRDISRNAQHCVGTFKIRCALRIPVSFKMTSVHQLDIVPQMGIILPNQVVHVQVNSNTSPKDWTDRLKMEGILLFAAPFVFNRGRTIDNVRLEDVQEFWGKFCSPRFPFAQTRFIFLRVYHQKKIVIEPPGVGDVLWKALRRLNYFAFHPKSKPFLSFPSELLRNKQLSPLGQMVLRRRQSLALEAHEQAERVNDSRFGLIFGMLVLVGAYVWYYLHIFLPEAQQRVELAQISGYRAWRNNLVKWLVKMWSSPSARA